jgi:CBS domain-containing protein
VRVDEVMTSPVHTVPPDLSPKQVSRFLVDYRVGCAPVVDATGALIGIVTEADLMQLELHRDPTRHQRRERAEPDLPPASIGQMMTTEVLAVPVDFDVADAARLMIERHVTRLPVVDGRLVVGILSRTDLLRLLTRDDATITREATRRLADVPGGWSVHVDRGVVTLTGDGGDDVERVARAVAWGLPAVIGVEVVHRGDSA